MIGVSNPRGYEWGESIKKRESDEHKEEVEIVYDSRSKEYMIKYLLFTAVKKIDRKDEKLISIKLQLEPLTLILRDKTLK